MKAMGRRLLPIIVLFFLSLAPTVHAQSLTSSIYGRLWGPTNTPVVEGYVIVTDEAIGTLLGEAVTTRYPGNKAGNYSIVGLPANKKLTVFAFHEKVPGFLTQKGVTLKPGESQKVVLEMSLGGWQDPGMISNPLLRLSILLKQAQTTRQANELIKRLEEFAKESGKTSVPPGFAYIGTNAQGYKEYRNEKDGSVMILIPKGDFLMGSNESDPAVRESDFKPLHKIYLDDFYIDKYEVNVGQFKKFVAATGYITDAEKNGGAWVITISKGGQEGNISWRNPGFSQNDNLPVVCLSWNDAKAYCDWAEKKLPTEAEWEKAARGTDGRMYPWGSEWNPSKCNGNEWDPRNDKTDHRGGLNLTVPVGIYPQGASPYGVMDMAGNAYEWCQDWYDENYYLNAPRRNPLGPSTGSFRVKRGGSFIRHKEWCTGIFRGNDVPNIGFNDCGLRCTR